MTYIWNRADKVPEEHKPHVLDESFKYWEDRKKTELKFIKSEREKKKILSTIKRQRHNYEDAIEHYLSKKNS